MVRTTLRAAETVARALIDKARDIGMPFLDFLNAVKRSGHVLGAPMEHHRVFWRLVAVGVDVAAVIANGDVNGCTRGCKSRGRKAVDCRKVAVATPFFSTTPVEYASRYLPSP